MQSPKTLTLKKFFIDELGFQNMKAKGFEPNYSYYKTNDAIVINIEVPGKCYLESSLQYTGEYTIIKLKGSIDASTRTSIVCCKSWITPVVKIIKI